MKNLLSILTLVITFNSFAVIIETNTMKDALSKADKDTLVIFDLDNTLMRPMQYLGTDEWYDDTVSSLKITYKKTGLKEELALNKAIDRAITIWHAIQKDTLVVAVEKETPQLISNLHKNGIKTMGLTARPLSLSKTTLEQLKSLNINLGNNTLAVDAHYKSSIHDVQFEGGILFVGPKNSKGQVFSKFIEEINFKPKKVLFVDDKIRHTQTMEEYLKNSGIDYTGHRYGATDTLVKAFDREITDIQYHYYKHLLMFLSDDDAHKYLGEKDTKATLYGLNCLNEEKDQNIMIIRKSNRIFYVSHKSESDVPDLRSFRSDALGTGKVSEKEVSLVVHGKKNAEIKGNSSKIKAFNTQFSCHAFGS